MPDEMVVLVTASSSKEAERIGNKLVQDRLVACVNVVSNVQSIFRWKGEICQEAEALMVIKSVESNLDEIITSVKQLHSYEVPEIIAVPIVGGSQEYLDWVSKESEH